MTSIVARALSWVGQWGGRREKDERSGRRRRAAPRDSGRGHRDLTR